MLLTPLQQGYNYSDNNEDDDQPEAAGSLFFSFLAILL